MSFALAAITESHETNATALVVFVALFGLVSVLGFVAARWRRAKLDHLDEWGLGGRCFGTVITWFLLGGDLYTAYTFIAVPALVFGMGAIGFFALPYTIIVYPLVFMVMPRLWSVCRANGYVTPADFVRGRYGSKHLGLVIAITGLLATMPYIALQLVGMQVVLTALGVEGDWPLIIAFVILAAYTYQSGLRAPALIAFVKDTLIYIVILVAVIYIPSKLGGFGAIFDAAGKDLPTHTPKPGALIPAGARRADRLRDARARLRAGAVLVPARDHGRAERQERADRSPQHRVAARLHVPARADRPARVHGHRARDRAQRPELRRPGPVSQHLPVVVRRLCVAAIAIGALVPAAVMSIAAANLFTRSIYKAYLRPDAGSADEARIAKIVSLLVKVGALVIIITLPTTYAIELQLLGGVWILQTLPAIVIGLYTRWLHRWALVAGWAVGMVVGTLMAQSQDFASTYPLELFGTKINAYTGIFALTANLVVTIALTFVLRRAGRSDAGDDTLPDDFDELAEDAEPPPRAVPAPVA